MGSVVEIEEEGVYDVEETIFVAVGSDIERSKTTLFWAVQSFAGKRICLLYVHRPAHPVALTDREIANNKLKQHAVKAPQECERRKVHILLDEYLLILAHQGVLADKVWIESDIVEEGIVDIIAQYNIRWLVMGAAADEDYSKKLMELKSKKAIFVCEQAPLSCHIWFTCNGCLIYTREGGNDSSKKDIALPLLLLNSDSETKEAEHLGSESATHFLGSLDVEEDAYELEGILRRFYSQCLENCSPSTSGVIATSKSTPLLMFGEEKTQGPATGERYHRLEKPIMEDKDSKQKAVEETIKRWKEEDDAMEAKCRAKALERLCIKEITQRKELEEELAKEKLEAERLEAQHEGFVKELQIIHDQNSVREIQIAESRCVEKELEEKIISAVELLISFKEKRDALRVEYENATREVWKQKKLMMMGNAGFCGSQILEFSFMEINEATHYFDPSWKIGDGKYGSLYKGLLRHVHVAIKMLPSYGSQDLLEFQKKVEALSRVRHPNLVTLIGTCPESSSLVYEYVRNGSLRDRLACKDNTPPIPWQARTCIAIEICSTLIFLHSNKPCIIHGNLKPSKILLDANFVSKISDLGIFHLIQCENTADTTPSCNAPNPKVNSVYMDPEFFETEQLTHESDVYSFGLILLQLLTGRPVSRVVKDVKCALENENLKAVLDCSAGDWPLDQAKQLAHLALRCCEKSRLDRPDLVLEMWSVLEPMRALCIPSESCLAYKEHLRIPSHFVCPIFQEVMKDPQIAADGFTYEADAIRGWLKSGHNTSPMTNLKLENCNLTPNYALHQAIQEWQQQW